MNSFYYCTRKAVSWGTFRLGCEIHYENNHLILCSRKSCSTCQRVCKWTLGYGSLSKRLHLGFFYNRQPNRIHLSQGYCFWYEYQWESEAAIAPLILVQRVFLVLIIHPGNPRSTIDSTLTILMSAASFFFLCQATTKKTQSYCRSWECPTLSRLEFTRTPQRFTDFCRG